jgi:hypothetical protein
MSTLVTGPEDRLRVLRALACETPATTTVYLRAARPDALAEDLLLRWRALTAELAPVAPPEDVAVLEPLALELPPGDRGWVAFAAHGEVRMAAYLDGYDGIDLATHGWPRVVPLLRWQQRRVPAAVAVVAHGSAVVRGYDADGRPLAVDDVAGADDEIERNAPGGWAQARYRRRAEDSWEHNAKQFAVHLARVADAVSAGVIVVAGDGRETRLVRDALPTHLRHLAIVDVAAVPEPAQTVDPATVTDAVRAAAARKLSARLRAFDEAVGTARAVEGAATTAGALDRGRVADLIIVAGDAPPALADSLTAAALAEDAHITVADSGDIRLADGVGALLRY